MFGWLKRKEPKPIIYRCYPVPQGIITFGLLMDSMEVGNVLNPASDVTITSISCIHTQKFGKDSTLGIRIEDGIINNPDDYTTSLSRFKKVFVLCGNTLNILEDKGVTSIPVGCKIFIYTLDTNMSTSEKVVAANDSGVITPERIETTELFQDNDSRIVTPECTKTTKGF